EELFEAVKTYEGDSIDYQNALKVGSEMLGVDAAARPSQPSASEDGTNNPGSAVMLPTDSVPQYDVFLSHNGNDKPSVERLALRLETEAGVRPFLDKWHLVPGEPWQEALEKALDDSATCAVFLGSHGLGPWENEEMRSALDERVREQSLRVIPVLLPGANPKDEKTLPRFLRRLTWVDFRAGINDHEAFRRLVAGIRGEAPGRSGG